MRRVESIYRYPIKGLSPAPLREVTLSAGRPFPFDRVFALLQPGMPMDPAAPRWGKKGLFLMLMMDEELARFDTSLDPETLEFRVTRPTPERVWSSFGREEEVAESDPLLVADLKTEAGRRAVEGFFYRALPRLSGPPRLVHAPDGHFMDKPDNVLSCIHLATLRSLEEELETPIHPLRFRANFYIDGGRPWEEFEWLGEEIRFGDVTFRVDRKNGRCGATNVNPVTAARDLDLPGDLRRRFGHKDFGVYLVAKTHGRVGVGDPVLAPKKTRAPVRREASLAEGSGRFVCRGCYYVYPVDEALSEREQSALFDALPEDFRCPDCGVTKSNFRDAFDG